MPVQLSNKGGGVLLRRINPDRAISAEMTIIGQVIGGVAGLHMFGEGL